MPLSFVAQHSPCMCLFFFSSFLSPVYCSLFTVPCLLFPVENIKKLKLKKIPSPAYCPCLKSIKNKKIKSSKSFVNSIRPTVLTVLKRQKSKLDAAPGLPGRSPIPVLFRPKGA